MRDLRSIYKDLPDLETRGKAYNEKYKDERTIKNEYEKAKAKKDNSWKQFKADFTVYTSNRCPVCEETINQFDDIEHYRPKDTYWWLAYDFYNYYNCCDLCNRIYKGIQFPLFNESKKVDFSTRANISDEQPLLFNPLKDNPFELFQLEFFTSPKSTIYPSVRIVPKQDLAESSYEYLKAKTTIEVFNLNDENPELTDPARTRMLNHFSYTLKHFREIVQEWKNETNPKLKAAKFQEIKEAMDRNGLFLCGFVLKGLYTVIPPVI